MANNTFTKNEILSDGIEFLVSLSEADGTEKTTVTAGTLTIYRHASHANVIVISGAEMTQVNASTWSYDFGAEESLDIQPGLHTAEFELTESGDVTRLYEEFTVIRSNSTNNKNGIYFNLPIDAYPVVGRPSQRTPWDDQK